QVEQVDDVPLLEADPAQFQPADLGPGRADPVPSVVTGNTPGLAQFAKLGAEKNTQHRRATARMAGNHPSTPRHWIRHRRPCPPPDMMLTTPRSAAVPSGCRARGRPAC